MSEPQLAASLHCGDGGVRSLIYFICSVEVYGSDTNYVVRNNIWAHLDNDILRGHLEVISLTYI